MGRRLADILFDEKLHLFRAHLFNIEYDASTGKVTNKKYGTKVKKGKK